MTYIPDSGPDTGSTSRTFVDRFEAIRDNWPGDSGWIVDFGAYNGRMARELAEANDLYGVAIEGEHGAVGDKRITAINEYIDAKTLGKHLRKEDNATVLCLSVLHHLPDWRKYVGVMERNAKYAFIEVANPAEVLPDAKAHDQSAAILKWVEKRGVPVGESPGWDASHVRTTYRIDFMEGN